MTLRYNGAGGDYGARLNRVDDVRYGGNDRATYEYNGMGEVIRTDLHEPGVFTTLAGTTSGTYTNRDRFKRITSVVWTKDLTTDIDFYDRDITYDRGSNITFSEDNIFVGYDVGYTIDDRDRLTQAERGTRSGSSITTLREDELWTLSQPSNWAVHKLDLNGDGLFTGTDELHDIGTFNTANELTARDIDNDMTDEFTLTYDAVGNLTDDGEHYKYVYDGRGWLVEIRNRANSNPIIRYDRYGNGWIALKTYDSDADGLLTDETAQAQIYDDRWRVTGVADEGSATIDEQWIYHHAGVNGASSYIDAILLWDKGMTRYYPIQDTQHQDVVVLLTDSGGQVEQIRYTPYGVPFNIPKGDVMGNVALEPNGSYDFNDTSHLVSELNASNYNVLYDENLDGTFDGNDIAAFSSATGGREVLSQVENSRGYTGMRHQVDFAPTIAEQRHRFYLSELGRWTSRDVTREELAIRHMLSPINSYLFVQNSYGDYDSKLHYNQIAVNAPPVGVSSGGKIGGIDSVSQPSAANCSEPCGSGSVPAISFKFNVDLSGSGCTSSTLNDFMDGINSALLGQDVNKPCNFGRNCGSCENEQTKWVQFTETFRFNGETIAPNCTAMGTITITLHAWGSFGVCVLTSHLA